MATPPPYPDTGPEPDRGSTTDTPWRMYLIWIVVIALLLLMVILHLTGIVGAGSRGL